MSSLHHETCVWLAERIFHLDPGVWVLFFVHSFTCRVDACMYFYWDHLAGRRHVCDNWSCAVSRGGRSLALFFFSVSQLESVLRLRTVILSQDM